MSGPRAALIPPPQGEGDRAEGAVGWGVFENFERAERASPGSLRSPPSPCGGGIR
jgi:hypothetical protein